MAGRHAIASERYLAAIAAAQHHDAPKREAIALELAAAHARDRGETERSAELLRQAVHACRRWGAHGRADELEASARP